MYKRHSKANTYKNMPGFALFRRMLGFTAVHKAENRPQAVFKAASVTC